MLLSGGRAVLPGHVYFRSLHRVLDRLNRPRPHRLARGLRGKRLLLLREWVDALAGWPGALLVDGKLREAVHYENPDFSQFLVGNVNKSLEDLLHVLGGDF